MLIENLPYAAFIDRYDRPGTLYYIDPPYRGSEGSYGKNLFERADFARLADQLAGIKASLHPLAQLLPGDANIPSRAPMARHDQPSSAFLLCFAL